MQPPPSSSTSTYTPKLKLDHSLYRQQCCLGSVYPSLNLQGFPPYPTQILYYNIRTRCVRNA